VSQYLITQGFPPLHDFSTTGLISIMNPVAPEKKISSQTIINDPASHTSE
jgi:hypothetical protein